MQTLGADHEALGNINSWCLSMVVGLVVVALQASCATITHETKRGELASITPVSSKIDYEAPPVVEVDAGVARLRFERRTCTESIDEFHQIDVETKERPSSGVVGAAVMAGVGVTGMSIAGVLWWLAAESNFSDVNFLIPAVTTSLVAGPMTLGGVYFWSTTTFRTDTWTKESPLGSTESAPGYRCETERLTKRGVVEWEVSSGNHRVAGKTSADGELQLGRVGFFPSMDPFELVRRVRAEKPPAVFVRLGNAIPVELTNLNYASMHSWARCVDSAAAAARNTCNQQCSSTTHETAVCGENMALCIEVAESEIDRGYCNDRFNQCVSEKAPDKRALSGCTSTCLAEEMQTRCKF